MKEQSKQLFGKKTLAAAVAAVSTGALLCGPQSTLAEEAMLEEVMVTATRRAESAQDIPYNITAVSGDDLEKANIREVAELMRTLPGVQYIDRDWRSGGVVNGILMRGVNIDAGAQGDVQLSAAPPVATYLNNTPLFVPLSLRDIERAGSPARSPGNPVWLRRLGRSCTVYTARAAVGRVRGDGIGLF